MLLRENPAKTSSASSRTLGRHIGRKRRHSGFRTLKAGHRAAWSCCQDGTPEGSVRQALPWLAVPKQAEPNRGTYPGGSL